MKRCQTPYTTTNGDVIPSGAEWYSAYIFRHLNYVPRKPLEILVEDRARTLAKKRLRATSHSMALEDQRVDEADEQDHLERIVQKLLDQPGSALWKGSDPNCA